MPRHRPIGVRLASNGAYWQAVWYDSSGFRRVKSLGAKQGLSKSRAKNECAIIAKEIAIKPALRDMRPDAMTVAGLCEWFLRVRTGLSPGSLALYQTTFKYLKDYFKAEHRIQRIQPAHAMEWAAWLVREKGVGHQTQRKHVRAAKTLWKQAEAARLAAHNPFTAIPSAPMAVDKDWRELTADEVARLIQAAPTPAWACMVALCAYAGLRRGEAMRLEWSHVDWDRNRLRVAHVGRRTTKKAAREVLMVDELRRVLVANRSAPRPAAIPANNLERTMRSIIAGAGLENWDAPFHTLRKWRATTWRDQYPESVVDSWLGHSLAVARGHYVQVQEAYYGPAPKPTIDLSALSADQLASLRAQLAALDTTTKNGNSDTTAGGGSEALLGQTSLLPRSHKIFS